MPFNGHAHILKPDGSRDDSWFPINCGWCGRQVSAAVVAQGTDAHGAAIRWLQCINCHEGSYVADRNAVTPGERFGPILQGLPERIENAYSQARDSMSVNAFTGAELLCRKILMHVAVDKNADEGKSFAHYLRHLESEGFITPPMKPWVNVIREHGNQAAHEIEEPDKTRAESTVMFTAELLRLVYEMEYLSKKYVGEPEKTEEPEEAPESESTE